jgi:hypothetical protein
MRFVGLDGGIFTARTACGKERCAEALRRARGGGRRAAAVVRFALRGVIERDSNPACVLGLVCAGHALRLWRPLNPGGVR